MRFGTERANKLILSPSRPAGPLWHIVRINPLLLLHGGRIEMNAGGTSVRKRSRRNWTPFVVLFRLRSPRLDRRILLGLMVMVMVMGVMGMFMVLRLLLVEDRLLLVWAVSWRCRRRYVVVSWWLPCPRGFAKVGESGHRRSRRHVMLVGARGSRLHVERPNRLRRIIIRGGRGRRRLMVA